MWRTATSTLECGEADLSTVIVDEDLEETAAAAPTAVSRRRRLLRDPAFVVPLSFLTLMALAATFASHIAPHDPLRQDLQNILSGPTADHWLGTDELGRDVLSRLLFAGQVSFEAALIAVGVALVLGFPLGLFVGYRGGRWDAATMRVSDGLMALPGLLIVIAVIGVFGNSLLPAMIALGVVLAPSVLRLTRGVALSIRDEPYVDAARVLGFRESRIIGRHVLPHVLPALIVQTSLLLGAALLIEAGLSFIGLGIQPPEAGWGSMLSNGVSLFRRQSFVLLPPGVMITLTVLALNVLGDAIRDAFRWSEEAPSVPSRRPLAVVGGAPTPPSPSESAQPTDTSTNAALEIRDLTVAFGEASEPVVVLSDVGLAVEAGRVLGVVGESGCGKTITARAALGLLPSGARLLSGSVRLFGRELVGLSDAELCGIRGDDIAMVFQDPTSSLDPAHTVGDQIGEPLRIHRGLSRAKARQQASVLLDQVGIAESSRRVRSYPHEFSGGMLQRVAIAAALACDPAVLVADEPTTALDVTVQAEILDLLRELQQAREMAMLLVTHDLGVVADICDDVVVMYAGQVVETAPVRTLLSSPQHPYTRALLDAMPRPEHRGSDLPTIPGIVPDPRAYPVGCRFADRCPHAGEACRGAGVPLRQLGHRRSVRCVLVPDG